MRKLSFGDKDVYLTEKEWKHTLSRLDKRNFKFDYAFEMMMNATKCLFCSKYGACEDCVFSVLSRSIGCFTAINFILPRKPDYPEFDDERVLYPAAPKRERERSEARLKKLYDFLKAAEWLRRRPR